jgi:hypothetical protein
VSGVTRTGHVDRRLTEIAEREGVLPKGLSPHGKTAGETKETQKPALLGKIGFTGGFVAAEGVLSGLERASGVSAGLAASVLGPAVTLAKLLYGFHQAHFEGAALRDGHARDAVNLAFVYAGAGALPSAYVAKLRVDLKAVDGERGGAIKILNRAMINDTEWQSVKKLAEEHVRIGRDMANRLHITSKEALAARLKSDRQFAVLCQQDLGFKHGVDSVIHDHVQLELYGKTGAP